MRTGDKIAIYMPMIPETVVAMLACARIGAPLLLQRVLDRGFDLSRIHLALAIGRNDSMPVDEDVHG